MTSNHITGEPKCPACGKLLDGFTELKSGTVPSAGDVSICLYCRNVGIFEVSGTDYSVQDATSEELVRLNSEPEFRRARRAIEAFHREHVL